MSDKGKVFDSLPTMRDGSRWELVRFRGCLLDVDSPRVVTFRESSAILRYNGSVSCLLIRTRGTA